MNDEFEKPSCYSFNDYLEAGNPSTGHDRLALLAVHEHPSIRARVAENTGAAMCFLLSLVHDHDPEVRCALASNPALPLHLFEILVLDENPNVRFTLAEDSNCPEKFLEILLTDSNPYVCDRARQTLKRLFTAGLGGKNDEVRSERKRRVSEIPVEKKRANG